MADIKDSPLGVSYDMLSLFCDVPESHRLLATTWAAHTHAFRTFAVTPRLYSTGIVPQAGKSTLMRAAVSMSADPVMVGYSSQAALYSWLDEHPDTTYGLDEADATWGVTGRGGSREIMRAVLDEGYSSVGKIMVMRNGHAVQIPVYCPCALAGIGRLPKTLMDRSVILMVEPGLPEEQYLPELHDEAMAFAGQQVGEWLSGPDEQKALKAAPALADLPGSPRFRQILAPLAAIADLAGCKEQFQTAVNEIVTGIAAKPLPSASELLLTDLRGLWPEEVPLLRGIEVIEVLHTHPSQRWLKISASRLGEIMLAGMLREQGIATQAANGVRGYRREDVAAVA